MAMDIEVGLDAAGLSYEAEEQITVDAARLGYARIWTGSLGDPFQTCALRWAATRHVVAGGIGTAIGVVPVGQRTPADLAQSASALGRLTGGRFVLGIGAGNVYDSAYRRQWGIEERSSLALVRAYLTTIRGFFSGERVTHRGQGISYDGAALPAVAPAPQLYLGVVGPEMARLGGELADGVYLSWCTPDNVQWIRTRVGEGAERAHRDPADVKLAASVRVSIDEDREVARRALAAALLPYVLGWDGTPPRAFVTHFERMGFANDVAGLQRMRRDGASHEQIIDAFSDPMMQSLGYFGPAAGAFEAVRRQVAGADIAVVRIVAARPGVEAARAVLAACRG
ncbi:MAG: LLM class flavin-dependent oxidoreductase [Acidimicrobiaceae bacterium]|nr:LLM class flavin-dependent oxidoreductase [Acidimicrobiaceae bacterium]